MDSNGMIEGAHCIRCGVELGTAIPAEKYAGTYTGLCYKCSNAKAFVAYESTLDSVREIDYPPSEPSWRRERMTVYGYLDCPTCKGGGVIRRQRSARQGGGSYKERCPECSSRYYSHPRRKEYQAAKYNQPLREHYERLFIDTCMAEMALEPNALALKKGQKRTKNIKPEQVDGFDIVKDSPEANQMAVIQRRLIEQFTQEMMTVMAQVKIDYADVINEWVLADREEDGLPAY